MKYKKAQSEEVKKVLTVQVDFYEHEEDLLKELKKQYSASKYIKDLIKKNCTASHTSHSDKNKDIQH